MTNEFMSQETKKQLINRVLSIQQSYLDTIKVDDELKKEGTEELPLEILISTITSLIIGITGLYVILILFRNLLGEVITNINPFIWVIIITASVLTIILYLKTMNERKKKSSENIVYSGKEFKTLVFFAFQRYIGEKGNIKTNSVMIADGMIWESDLLIESRNEKIPVEIKYRKDKVFIETVHQLIDYKEKFDIQRAIIVTNVLLTNEAKILAEKNGIIIIEKVSNEADIINFLNRNPII